MCIRDRKRSLNLEKRRNASVDRQAGRPTFVLSRQARSAGPIESNVFQSLDRAGRPFLFPDRPVRACVRRAHRLIGLCSRLLHVPFLFLLTSGLCAIFLYLFYLLSPYMNTFIKHRITFEHASL